MRNIELKLLYWESDANKRVEIKNILLKRKNKQFRVRQGNIDFLITLIDPITEDDEKIAIMVNGLFTMPELANKNILL